MDLVRFSVSTKMTRESKWDVLIPVPLFDSGETLLAYEAPTLLGNVLKIR